MKVLISTKTGLFYYYNGSGELHTKEGFFKEEDLKDKTGIVITSNSENKKEFLIFDANNYDITKKFLRGPQIITPKDLGYIISRTGINKFSKIVEAGGGSGFATTFFAGIVKEITTYEINENNCSIIKKNLQKSGFDNCKLINKDINECIEEETEIDMLFLDMPDIDKLLEKNLKGVKSGSYVVCYVPSICQIQDIHNTIKSNKDLYMEEISEIIIRNWKVTDKISRPEHRKEIDHTAFLCFIRKI